MRISGNILLLGALLIGFWSGQARSFTGVSFASVPLGACSVETLINDGGLKTANMSVFQGGTGFPVGGAFWAGAVVVNQAGVTASYLETDCGFSDVTILAQLGADGGQSFATQTEMYLRFQARETVGGPLLSIDVTMGETGVVSIGRTPVPEGQPDTSGFLQSRGAMLIGAQPNLVEIAASPAAGRARAHLGANSGDFHLASRAGSPVWAMLSGGWRDQGQTEDRYVFGAIGAQRQVSSRLWLGMLVEIDEAERSDPTGRFTGQGYLIGPYLVAQAPEQPLYVEARLLAGQTENRFVSDTGAVDDFGTDRYLASIRVAGRLHYGSTIVTPGATVTHLREVQHSYTRAAGSKVARQVLKTSNAAISLDFEHALNARSGASWLTGGISAHWSASSTSVQGPDEELRGRINLGLRHNMAGDGRLNVQLFRDGLGGSDFDLYGLQLSFERKF